MTSIPQSFSKRVAKLWIFGLANRSHIILLIICSLILIFTAIPILFGWDWKAKFISKVNLEGVKFGLFLIGFFSLTLIWNYWENFKKFWRKYKNTFNLEKPSFTYVDSFGVFILSTTLILTNPLPPFEDPDFLQIFLSLIFLAISVLIFIALYSPPTPDPEEKPEERSALSDEPIEHEDEDKLERSRFIQSFYEEIVNYPFSETFVYSLNGAWGDGKTSALNLLTKKLLKNNNFLVINFKPWYFKDDEAILRAFYEGIEKKISDNFIFPNLRGTISKYEALIATGLSKVGINFGGRIITESIEDVKNKIQDYILQTNKRWIIIIDDIDRLPPKEMLLIFKLVRLNSNFKKTIFILSFDQEAASKTLDDNWTTIGKWSESEVNLTHKKVNYVF